PHHRSFPSKIHSSPSHRLKNGGTDPPAGGDRDPSPSLPHIRRKGISLSQGRGSISGNTLRRDRNRQPRGRAFLRDELEGRKTIKNPSTRGHRRQRRARQPFRRNGLHGI